MKTIKTFEQYSELMNEKKKMNAGLRAYLDKKAGKKTDKDGDKDDKKDSKKSDKDDDKDDKKTKGLSAKQQNLPDALKKSILAKQKK